VSSTRPPTLFVTAPARSMTTNAYHSRWRAVFRTRQWMSQTNRASRANLMTLLSRCCRGWVMLGSSDNLSLKLPR
jgi:hypothetical protein